MTWLEALNRFVPQWPSRLPYVRRSRYEADIAYIVASREKQIEWWGALVRNQDREIVSLRRERDGWHGLATKWHVELCRLEDLTGLHGDAAWADVAPPEATIVITPTETGVAASAR